MDKDKRRGKVRKLRVLYNFAKTSEEKSKIVEKALKVNPDLTERTFLDILKTPEKK